MKFGKLKEVDGAFVREAYEWLTREQMGCCSICFASDDNNDYAVAIGWHNRGDRVVAWKIGFQPRNSVMSCDLDIDFDMPYNPETWDVDDTEEVIEVSGGKPIGYPSWDSLATYIRKEARRVWRDWKGTDWGRK